MSYDLAVCVNPDCDKGEDGSPATFERFPLNKKYCTLECKADVRNVVRRREFLNDFVAATASLYDLEPDVDNQLDFLRKENQRLASAAEKYKNSKYELIEAVYRAARDNFASVQYKPVKEPRLERGNRHTEVAVAPIADMQLGKVTPTYNTGVCAERIDLYGDKIIQLTDIQRSDHPVNELRVWMLGDIVEGEEIFSGQSHLIDRSLYAQVAKDGPQILGDFLRKMLGVFETVKVTAVLGNHGWIGGRARKDYNSETNMDRMLYKILEHIFQHEPRISFNIPDGYGERNFYAVDYIGDYGTLLVHGDQFPAPSALHAYAKKVMLWKGGGIPQPFDDVYCGHYHQVLKATFGTTILRMAGSTESWNTFAQEILGVMGRPSQPLQFVHPRRGVTCEYTCYLD